MPKILQMIGYSTSQIGAVFALAPLMRFIVPFFFLKHFELSQKVFYAALIGAVTAIMLFYPTVHSFYWFMLPNMLLGACLGMILPYVETFAMEHLQKERFGRSRLFGSIGFMLIGIVLARHLENASNALHYLLAAIFLTALSAYWLTHNNTAHTTQNITQVPLKKLHVIFLWISFFLMQVSFGAFYNFFTIYETQHGISLEVTSYLWSFGVICEILMLYFQSPLLKNNLLNIIKFCVAITTLRWALLYLYPDSLYLIFFTQSIHAFSFGLYHSAVIIYLYSLYENKKLAQQFMYGVAYGFGGFIGAFIAGFVYGEYLFLYSSIFAFLSFIMLLLNNHKINTQRI